MCLCTFFKKLFSRKPEKSMDDIEAEAKELLEIWKVETYANNQYLMKIPEERIKRKYHEIVQRLIRESKN